MLTRVVSATSAALEFRRQRHIDWHSCNPITIWGQRLFHLTNVSLTTSFSCFGKYGCPVYQFFDIENNALDISEDAIHK